MLAPLGISAFGHLAWLDYLYIISYIKLVVTPIKYIPQVSWGNITRPYQLQGSVDLIVLLLYQEL